MASLREAMPSTVQRAQKCNGINEPSAMPKKIHRKSVEQKSNPTMQKANPIIHKLVIVQKITPPKLGN